jgi:triacylglycerol esterase/lipase EstA (alpha/beta hydrolase family)
MGGVLPIEQSAHELDDFVTRVLAATGADKIDLVGHSEGTFMPQYWLKFLGGAAKTNRYVAMTPLYGGTTVYGIDKVRDLAGYFGLAQPGIDLVASFCGSCPEFLAGSPMQRKLVTGGAAAPGVEYTTIMTELDELVIPWSSGFLEAPGAHNYVLQEICPHDYSEHGLVAFDPVAAQLTFNALDPAHAQNVTCGGTPAIPGL